MFGPFNKKKRKEDRDEFSFLFDMGKLEKLMEDLMKDMFAEQGEFQPRRKAKPLVMGFSMKVGPEGKPVFEEFGNVKPSQGKPTVLNAREPLADVQELEKEYLVTYELPGVKKEEIDLKIEQNKLILSAGEVQNPFFKEILLPKAVDKNSIKASFNNGVLEVTIKKVKNENKDKIKIN